MQSLSDYSTWKVGGPADYLIEATSIEEVQEALRFAHEKKIPWITIGKGSNALFPDEGFRGVVIINKISFLERDNCTLHVGSGYSFSRLGIQSARWGLSGLEFASGIPASTGGAIFMNAGANGKETSETLISVDYVHANGKFEVLKDLHFSYRHSPFHEMNGVIVGGTFNLKKDRSARATQIDIIERRKATQPLREPSCGCIFRNPEGGHAGALIEQCNLKGKQIGGAAISEIHANFIVNKGGATANDINKLIEYVREEVKAQTGTKLECEVRHV